MRKPRKIKKYLILGGLAILLSAAGFYFYTKNQQPEQPNFQILSSDLKDITVTALSTGTVQPQNRLEIKPPISGRVESVLVQEGDRVRPGQTLAWMSSTERAALLDSARSRGPEELERWQELFRPTPILAPIQGMIIQKNVEPGQTFTSSDAVLVISDRLTVKAQVDETDIALIKEGQKATIILDAYARSPITARVDKIAFDAQMINNVTSYLVDVVPLETPTFMRSGMTANVTFVVEEKEQVIAIPNEALRTRRGQYYVLVPGLETTRAQPTQIDVDIGISDGRFTEILRGISAGQSILIDDVSFSGRGGTATGSPFAPFGRRSGGRGR